jgi:hypothetical protein
VRSTKLCPFCVTGIDECSPCDFTGRGCRSCREETKRFTAWVAGAGAEAVGIAEHGVRLAKLEANDPMALFVPVGNPDNYSMDCY